MKNIKQKISTCWCGGNLGKSTINLGDIPSCDAYSTELDEALQVPTAKVEIAICDQCSLIQLTERFNPSEIYQNYIYKTSDSPGLVDHFHRFAKYVNDEFSDAVNVLDIGCNEGILLKELQEKYKLNVLGVEPSDIGKDGCLENNVEVIQNYFTTEITNLINREYGLQDLIFANNVLANIEDLSEFMINVNNLLATKGFFIFETIIFEGIIDSMTVEMVNHEHYYYFTDESVHNLCLAFGFKMIKSIKMDLKGGSARYICQKIGKPIKPNEITYIEYKNIDKFNNFRSSLSLVQDEIYSYLQKMKSNGFSIYGFGAHAGATILIYALKLEGLIDCLFDDNKRRENLYSPGTGIMVRNIKPTEILDKSILVVFAWRYFEQIKNRHKNKLGLFDKIIIPLPKMIILNK